MWDAFKDFIFNIIDFFYGFCHDWGLAIIIVTVIIRALLTPLMYKQSKSSYMMRKMQPKLAAIKERFPNDVSRQNEETQKLYAEAKFNPLAGCLPMIIQMPIFIALFQVLREMADRVEANEYHFFNIIPDLVTSPSEAVGQGAAYAAPYIILLIIFAGATFLPTFLMQRKQGAGGAQQKTSLIMMIAMSVFMLWIGWGSPAGVLLFWGASSLIAILQQQLSLRHLEKKDAQSEEEAPLLEDVVVTRKVKKKRQKKSR